MLGYTGGPVPAEQQMMTYYLQASHCPSGTDLEPEHCT
jgi:hypothetical protein